MAAKTASKLLQASPRPRLRSASLLPARSSAGSQSYIQGDAALATLLKAPHALALSRHISTATSLQRPERPLPSRRSFGNDILPEALPESVDETIRHWGLQTSTAVTLKELCEIGLDRKRRRLHGQFLHRELKIRLSQRVLQLSALPYGLPERVGIRDVIRWYTDFVYDLEDSPEPLTASQDEEFTSFVSRIFEEHAEVIQAMAFGVQDLMQEMGEDYRDAQAEIDRSLRSFFIARIGVRFLLQHHIESYRNRSGCSGILQLECNPALGAQKAADDSAGVCRAHLGRAPRIIIDDVTPGTFTYVPMHLHYMLMEVLKNACRAVVEWHGDGELPPIRIRIVHGQDDLTLKISDEGGGFSRERARDVWKFMWSTYKKSPWSSVLGNTKRDSQVHKPSSADSISNPLQRPGRSGGPPGALAGYGVGLSLSRLYAQYFGGDLRILSLDGYGTDVYLHLSRLGTHCENLPNVVQLSPSMRDSSLLDDSGEEEDRLLISFDEESFLRQELLNLRREQLEQQRLDSMLEHGNAVSSLDQERYSLQGP